MKLHGARAVVTSRHDLNPCSKIGQVYLLYVSIRHTAAFCANRYMICNIRQPLLTSNEILRKADAVFVCLLLVFYTDVCFITTHILLNTEVSLHERTFVPFLGSYSQ